MTYAILDNKSVVDYVLSIPSLREMFGAKDSVTAREVGDGNLNLVFIVGNSAKKVVVKQAIPYLRIAGESWRLDRERMRFESQALTLHNKLAPGLVPAVYHIDLEMSLVVMEYLGQHIIMRKELINRKRFPLFVDHISTFMAETLFKTSDLYLTGAEKKKLQGEFINTELCKITEDFVFTNPYKESPENKWNRIIDPEVQELRSNSLLKVAIAEMKEGFMTHAQSIVHGDLHTGSIMINESETRVIDPEFAFYGPIGFDVGAVLGNLALNYCSHFVRTPDPSHRKDYQAYLLELIRGTWNEFARKFDNLWRANNRGELCPASYWDFPGGEQAFAEYRRRYIQQLLQDSAGYGGCKMMRRILGIAHVEDIEGIADPQQRAPVERMALQIGAQWVTEKASFDSIEDLINAIVSVTSKGEGVI
jgi:5-methylthioribose kinase